MLHVLSHLAKVFIHVSKLLTGLHFPLVGVRVPKETEVKKYGAKSAAWGLQSCWQGAA